jgi:N6-L-threonylcarbamoyladenine synthase
MTSWAEKKDLMTTRILGIESSCDETAAAVVADGREILSNVIASQMDVHQKYGGVVPELASRQHLRSIVPVVREALDQAGMEMRDVAAIAVTQGPGLVGSLLVGLTYGKALALSLGKPLIAVNHIEGHVHAVFLEARQALLGQGYGGQAGREPKLPAICLIVSGGHTVLYEVTADRPGAVPPGTVLRYRRIGQTRDDAAGEAYDKVARLLALGYPGGPIIDQLAASRGTDQLSLRAASTARTRLTVGAGKFGQPDSAGIRFGEVRTKGNPYDFSFSGIKTAVLYYVRKHPEFEPEIEARRKALSQGKRDAAHLLPLVSPQTLELLVNFQKTVISELVGRTLKAAAETAAQSVLVSGGVAANRELRATFEREAQKRALDVFFPSRELSTDNAAMIAAAAYPKLLREDWQGAALNAEAALPLA